MIKECHVSENLFDKSTATLNERVTTSGTTSYTGAFASDYISIGENVNCTVTGLITSIVTVIYFYDSSNTNIGYTSADSASSYSFTTPTGTAKLRFTGDMNYINSASVIINTWNTKSYCKATTGSKTYSNFPIVVRSREQSISSWNMKGNEQHTGTASPTSPIEINGTGERTANLFDKDRTQGIIANAYINQSGQQVSSQNYYLSYPIPVEPNQDYTWSFNTGFNALHSAPTVAFYDTNDTLLSVATHDNNIYWFNFTTPNDCAYIRASVYTGQGNYTNQLLLGSKSGTGKIELPFIPYGYKIPISANGTALTPVYLTEQLMEISDYADSLASSGTVTRHIKKIVFNGSETGWTIESGTTYVLSIADQLPTSYENAICSHYVLADSYNNLLNTNNTFAVSRRPAFFIHDNTLTTVDALKTYLATQYANGTPVTVYYVIETAVTEQVTVPTIPTTSSPTTIDVNTSVKPSEMSLTYDGYKICKEQKYQNNAWT